MRNLQPSLLLATAATLVLLGAGCDTTAVPSSATTAVPTATTAPAAAPTPAAKTPTSATSTKTITPPASATGGTASTSVIIK